MTHRIFISALALTASAMVFSAPASAQLLGGSGGLTGGLGGTLGDTLGNPTGPIGGTLGSAGELAGSGRGEANVDRRSGRVHGKGSADANGKGSANGNSDLLGNAVGGSAGGSGGAAGDGSLDAQAIGTDFVGQTAHGATGAIQGPAQSTASTVTGTTHGAVGTVRDRAGGTLSNVSGSTSAAGSAAGSFQGALGQLAAAGSGAASGSGMFAVEPGMAVTDTRGKVIGYVQDLHQTGRGVVQAVTVEVGNRVATLPAASFAGSGDVLVTGMTKGQIKDAAGQQQDRTRQPATRPAPHTAQSGNRSDRSNNRN